MSHRERPSFARRALDRMAREVGGPARFHVISLLAAVLALDGADKGTISATADDLKHAFGLSNTDIGLLLTVPALIGALFTLPVGALTDRVRRTRLLGASIVMWAAATLLSGAAHSFLWLMLSRVALGAVSATAGPTIASLTGDFFPARERAKLYGFVLAGELIGTGIGFVVSGDLAVALSWRVAFWWLAVPALLLAVLVWRLPEPARGGQSRIEKGQEELTDARELADRPLEERIEDEQAALLESREGVAKAVLEKEGVEPDERLVLPEDPAGKSLWWAVKYALRVRTNLVIVVASALGYFYFSGLRGFALIFAEEHYSLSKAVANNVVIVVGLGSVVGVFAGGRVADALLKRGVVSARVIVPAVVMLVLSFLLAPAIWTTSVWLAIPLLTAGAALLGAANPPQDAARLDIIHPMLWGRSESVRTVARTFLEAAAPTVFGYTADHWFGGHGGAGETGLELTFLLFLLAVVAAGLTVLLALRTYPRDVATATAYAEATMGHGRSEARSGAGSGAERLAGAGRVAAHDTG
ncbi:MAG: MFS transporter [Frankiaceae bacterium]